MAFALSTDETKPRHLTASEADPDRVVDQIIPFFDDLSEFERELVMRKLDERLRLISTPRAGTVLQAVANFFKQEKPAARALTTVEIQGAVQSQGVEATAKEIYNALGYLTRKKKITRIKYGEYIASGVAGRDNQ